MYKIILCIVILSLNLKTARSQYFVKGNIADNNSAPLQYVNIGIVGTKFGTVSDIDGNFKLLINKAEITNNDTLRISIIGYETNNILIDSVIRYYQNNRNLSIVLNHKMYDLSEVVISSNRPIIKQKGKLNVSLLNMVVNFALSKTKNQNLGSEIGKKFNINHKNTLINSFRFKLQHNNFDSVVFRINVYSLKRNMPFKNLLKQNILVYVKNKKTGWIEINMSSYNIIVNDDIIVSIEWVAKSDNGNLLTLPISMPTPYTHYYKFGSQNKWKRFRSMTTKMELEITY